MEKLKPTFTVQDDRFDVSDLATKELYLEFQRNKFVFIVKCIKTKQIQWLEEYAIGLNIEALQGVFQEHTFLKANFWSKIVMIYHPKDKTVVPSSYFENTTPDLLLPSFKTDEKKPTFGSFKINPQSHLLYHKEQDLFDFIQEVYPQKNIETHPMDTCLNKVPNCIIMHFEKDVITLQILKEGDVLQSMFIPFEALKKFKSIIQSLDLETQADLILNGEITTYSKFYTWLSSQFSVVKFGRPLGSVRLSQFFSEVPKHKYVTIVNATALS